MDYVMVYLFTDAVLMTETITGQQMYDSGPDSCYYMEFDQTGKIIKVYCGRPIGG